MNFLIFTLAVCLAGAPLGYLQQALADTSAASNRTGVSTFSTGISLAQNSNIISFSRRLPPVPAGVSRGRWTRSQPTSASSRSSSRPITRPFRTPTNNEANRRRAAVAPRKRDVAS